jgi:hypothetical protein
MARAIPAERANIVCLKKSSCAYLLRASQARVERIA